MTIEIERRSNLSRAQFQAEYASKSRPVILTDAIDHWPARGKWDLDYFEARFSGKQVCFDKQTWDVGQFIQALKQTSGQGVTPYLKEVKLDEQFPELWQDIAGIAVARGNRLGSRLLPTSMRIDRGTVAVFIGAKGSGFRKLHWDYSYLHVFISQIHGPKDVLLFHPDNTPHLYANPEHANLSLIPDPFEVDLQAFPAFASAEPSRLTIAEGETLFLPAGWWHATRINEPSIAIAESTLDHFNWNVRSRWFLDHYARERVPAAKRMALRAYLGLIDAIL